MGMWGGCTLCDGAVGYEGLLESTDGWEVLFEPVLVFSGVPGEAGSDLTSVCDIFEDVYMGNDVGAKSLLIKQS